MTFQKPKFTDEALAPHDHDRRTRPVVELAPGLARAPRVAKLLNNAYDIAHRELSALNERHFLGLMDDGDWSRFGMLLKNLPALLREERAGDEQRMKLLQGLPEATLKELVANYYDWQEKHSGQAAAEDGQGVEGGQDPNDVGGGA